MQFSKFILYHFLFCRVNPVSIRKSTIFARLYSILNAMDNLP